MTKEEATKHIERFAETPTDSQLKKNLRGNAATQVLAGEAELRKLRNQHVIFQAASCRKQFGEGCPVGRAIELITRE